MTFTKQQLASMANAIRMLSADAVQQANSGHPGMPIGMADVATVLFSKFLKFNPQDPDWADRDRFILSAGHGSMLLYSLLHLTGYKDVPLEEIKNFRQLGAVTAGHPEFGEAKGIEMTTGPLGQGLATSVGFALAERLLNSRFGNDLVDHHTYVIAGDGCLMEGISHEAISLAGHLKLGKLVVLFDDNGISIDGSTDLTVSDDQLKRFEASGWDVQAIDGHDFDAIEEAISNAKASDKPSMIACKTTIAYGAPTKQGTSASHGAPLGDDEIKGLREFFDWNYGPFEVPDSIRNDWVSAAEKGAESYSAWQQSLNGHNERDAFEACTQGKIGPELDKAMTEFKESCVANKPKWATRKSSGQVLSALTPTMPYLLGGSADLTGSNLTKAGTQNPISRDDFSGNYVYYGVREHGMAAAMNGVALHGGFIPYGGTFLVFTDYCRPSIRLSALMHQRVIYVMTHDSIGLGEDGPTHQPVEHVSSLRAMPNVLTFRPCDPIETAESWEIALKTETGPSVLALTRQGLPTYRSDISKNYSAKGAYVLAEAEASRQVTIFATGSEVEIAMNAKAELESKSVGVRVVSVPCAELFWNQDEAYQASLLDNDDIKVAVEAGCKQGWESFIGRKGVFVGMDSFGASAPADQLYKHFGITAENIVNQVEAALSPQLKSLANS